MCKRAICSYVGRGRLFLICTMLNGESRVIDSYSLTVVLSVQGFIQDILIGVGKT